MNFSWLIDGVDRMFCPFRTRKNNVSSSRTYTENTRCSLKSTKNCLTVRYFYTFSDLTSGTVEFVNSAPEMVFAARNIRRHLQAGTVGRYDAFAFN